MATQSSYRPAVPPHQLRQPQTQPAPPQPAPQHKSRPPSGKNRSFSFRSDKSHKSHGSNVNKIDLHETSLEKEAKRLHTKADPTMAISEAEPAEVAASGTSSLAPLRNIQHKDVYGNPIAEPDRSNPTRSRWERPLDTIRSFEAAIDGQYTSRKSFLRSDSESVAFSSNNKRSSYYANNGPGGRFSHDSYYGGRPQSTMYSNRYDGSQPDLRQQRETYYDQSAGYGNGYGPPPPHPGRRGYPRGSSEPPFAPQHRGYNGNEYAIPSNHRSYETVASATGSGSGSFGEPAGYQTDPTSSDNSSIERMQPSSIPRRQPEPVTNDYGIGFNQGSEYQSQGFSVGVRSPIANNGETHGYNTAGTNSSNGNNNNSGGNYSYTSTNTNGYNQPPPAPPQKDRGAILRKPTASQYVQERPAQPEKRKSWFARRFSKSG